MVISCKYAINYKLILSAILRWYSVYNYRLYINIIIIINIILTIYHGFPHIFGNILCLSLLCILRFVFNSNKIYLPKDDLKALRIARGRAALENISIVDFIFFVICLLFTGHLLTLLNTKISYMLITPLNICLCIHMILMMIYRRNSQYTLKQSMEINDNGVFVDGLQLQLG